MAVSVELHNTGDPAVGREVQALVEHALSDRAGDWRVSITRAPPWIVCMSTRAIEPWEPEECARPGTCLARTPWVLLPRPWHGRRASCRSEQRAKPSGTYLTDRKSVVSGKSDGIV